PPEARERDPPREDRVALHPQRAGGGLDAADDHLALELHDAAVGAREEVIGVAVACYRVLEVYAGGDPGAEPAAAEVAGRGRRGGWGRPGRPRRRLRGRRCRRPPGARAGT